MSSDSRTLGHIKQVVSLAFVCITIGVFAFFAIRHYSTTKMPAPTVRAEVREVAAGDRIEVPFVSSWFLSPINASVAFVDTDTHWPPGAFISDEPYKPAVLMYLEDKGRFAMIGPLAAFDEDVIRRHSKQVTGFREMIQKASESERGAVVSQVSLPGGSSTFLVTYIADVRSNIFVWDYGLHADSDLFAIVESIRQNTTPDQK